ncbi:MAG: hypothetical protein BGO67_04115 [Alphaproteobacteria bacterium 41-28]|nr:MAG: hypothetical protein BGO67_04115 [Alphaproteobacteria bacterium 41-28]
MEENEVIFRDDIYSQHLATINNIKFTPREIDIIACLLSARRTSQIASILSIAPRTVTTHFRNITLRLDCNSQEGIINFVERSHKLFILRKYYSSLITELAFEKALKEISKLRKTATISCLIVYWQDKDLKKVLTYHLQDHLNLAGLNVEVREQNADQKIELIENTTKILLFLLEKKDDHEVSQELAGVSFIEISHQKNYYLSVFEILIKLLPDVNLKSIITLFTKQYESIEDPSGSKLLKVYREQKIGEDEKWIFHNAIHIFRHKKPYFVLTFFVLCILGIGFLSFEGQEGKRQKHVQSKNIIQENQENLSVRSDLVIPTESALLHRSGLIAKIDNRLKSQNGIQTIALVGMVGMGGVGKTTLARLYARSQNQSIAYEINAETQTGLFNSFKNLAYCLAKTKDQKDELSFILKIQNPEDRETQLLSFIKSQLKRNPNWLLIYDNVKSLLDIKSCFPHDPKVWGNGKVIITSRNTNIDSSSYIGPSQVIQIETLNLFETLTLFSKIYYQCDPAKLTIAQKEKIISFLKNIPPFPLDVSLAAHYLKSTHISFEKYLERIKQHNDDFEKSQEILIKESSDYTKTRFGIITSSIENLIHVNPKFKDLLFFISLLDSQNIPLSLLEASQKDLVVDDFKQSLKRDGLVIWETNLQNNTVEHLFSIHRSTQAITLAYLINLLKKEEREKCMEKVISALRTYYHLHSEKKFSNMILLIPHLEFLLKNMEILTISNDIKEKYIKYLYLRLAYTNEVCADNSLLAKKYFIEVFNKEIKNRQLSDREFAYMLRSLAAECADLGDLGEALFYAQECIKICNKIPNFEVLIIESLKIMGYVYGRKNNFERAKFYLQAALNKIREIKGEESKEIEAELYNQLAELYSSTYINKNLAFEAEGYILKALETSEALLPLYSSKIKNETSHRRIRFIIKHKWRLGHIYCRLGKYKEAMERGFKEAEYIINKTWNDYPYQAFKGFVLCGMGEALLREGQVKLAEDKLTKAILINEKTLGVNNSAILEARVYRAEARIRLGQLGEAYEDCVSIFKMERKEKNNYLDLIYLASIYHAAIIKYRQEDIKKSLEHFADFFNYAEPFCKLFLDEKIYRELESKGIFIKILYDNRQPADNIKQYLKNCYLIFSAIYGESHPFVRDYVLQNEKLKDNVVDRIKGRIQGRMEEALWIPEAKSINGSEKRLDLN